MNITLIYTQTHTPSLEELISIFLPYPPRSPPVIRTVVGKVETEPPKRPQNGKGGGWGGEGRMESSW